MIWRFFVSWTFYPFCCCLTIRFWSQVNENWDENAWECERTRVCVCVRVWGEEECEWKRAREREGVCIIIVWQSILSVVCIQRNNGPHSAPSGRSLENSLSLFLSLSLSLSLSLFFSLSSAFSVVTSRSLTLCVSLQSIGQFTSPKQESFFSRKFKLRSLLLSLTLAEDWNELKRLPHLCSIFVPKIKFNFIRQ